ncbi:hypothetical protein EC968_001135 [Mortierella alpina]|nr:hypothetical protein EC968_001135 [Mortierella alpina]
MKPARGGWSLLLAIAFVSTRASLTSAQTDSTSQTRSTTTDAPNATASPSLLPPAPDEPANPAQPPANPTTTSTPDPAAGMAYGSNDRLMLIQGGNAGSRGPSNQFFSLDFTQSWTVDAPAWRNLTSINAGAAPSISGMAGTLTKDDDFLVVTQQNGDATSGSIFEYKFSQSEWFPLVSQQNAITSRGPLVVTDLDSGIIYFLGDGLSLQRGTADPSAKREMKGSELKVPSGQAGSWSPHEKRLLSTVVTSNRQMDVQASNLQDADGSKYYMFGGSFMADNKLNGELFILNMQSKLWSRAPMASPRTKMACAVAGNSLVIWGGYQDIGETLLVDNRPIIFDTALGEWVQRFTTTFNPFAPSVIDTGSANPTQGSSAATGGSNVGAIIGGTVGGVAVLALIAGLFIFRRRRFNRDHRKGFDTHGRHPESGGGKGGVGKRELSKSEVEMGGYKTIPSPFTTDDTVRFDSDPYPSQNQQHPITAPYLQQQPLQQQLPITASRPTTASSHPRSQSQLSNTVPLIIASPFDSEADASMQHPLLHQPNVPMSQPCSVPLPPLAPRPPSVQYQYYGQHPHRHGDEDDGDDNDPMSTVLSRSLEPTTVDLIPISASEAGDGSMHSRTNSVSSNRSLSPMPCATRAKGRENSSSGARGAVGATSGVDNDRGPLGEPGDGRRGSTDSLDYLDIS